LWPNFKVLSWHSPRGTEENHENLNRDSQSQSRDLNSGPPEYEAGMLIMMLNIFIIRLFNDAASTAEIV
jgi:hypothetical protein